MTYSDPAVEPSAPPDEPPPYKPPPYKPPPYKPSPYKTTEEEFMNAVKSKDYMKLLTIATRVNMDYEPEDYGNNLFMWMIGVDASYEMITLMRKTNSSLINKTTEFGESPLHRAVIHSDIRVLEDLIKHGANLDARDNTGATAMFYAAIERNYQAVRLLIESGANIKLRDRQGDSVVMLAETDKKLAAILSKNNTCNIL